MTFADNILIITCILVAAAWFTSLSTISSFSSSWAEEMDSYVGDACSVTRYPDLCIHSLASYSNSAKRDPRKWARAGVSVTISEAKLASQYLARLESRNTTRGRDRAALSDCIELFQDTLDNLHGSLGALRNFTGQGFDSQMRSAISWLSAALTDQNTCLDGFSGQDREDKMKQIQLLQKRVLNTTYMTSNALALVNRLATSGPERSGEILA
ncbi:pectinesterase inhibitor 6-like [Coffea arabica]|uniref:pectinesterase n=1 Tax=Coffea arabica TaxID=13443 RepID=A0A6P6V726_COFAR|nr:pectinesterase inhibitor 6-like [Coffea arabica]